LVDFVLPIPPLVLTISLDSSFSDADVSLVHINGPVVSMERGVLDFYNKPYLTSPTMDMETSYYLGKAGLFAGIISEVPDIYNCNTEAAFKRLWAVSRVYVNRTIEFDNLFQNDEDCFPNYNMVLPDMINIRDRSNSLVFNFPPGTSAPIDNIYIDMNSLRAKQEALHYTSCPQSY